MLVYMSMCIYMYICVYYICIHVYISLWINKRSSKHICPLVLNSHPWCEKPFAELKCPLKYGHIFMCIIYLHIWVDLWYGRHHVTCNIHKIPPNINQTRSDVIFINMKNRKSWIPCHDDRWDPDICLMSCNCHTPNTLLSWIPTLMYMYPGGAVICRDLVSLGTNGNELDKSLNKGPYQASCVYQFSNVGHIFTFELHTCLQNRVSIYKTSEERRALNH